MLTRVTDALEGGLWRTPAAVAQAKLGHAEHSAQRGANFMAHVGQELALDARQALGLDAGCRQVCRALGHQLFEVIAVRAQLGGQRALAGQVVHGRQATRELAVGATDDAHPHAERAPRQVGRIVGLQHEVSVAQFELRPAHGAGRGLAARVQQQRQRAPHCFSGFGAHHRMESAVGAQQSALTVDDEQHVVEVAHGLGPRGLGALQHLLHRLALRDVLGYPGHGQGLALRVADDPAGRDHPAHPAVSAAQAELDFIARRARQGRAAHGQIGVAVFGHHHQAKVGVAPGRHRAQQRLLGLAPLGAVGGNVPVPGHHRRSLQGHQQALL